MADSFAHFLSFSTIPILIGVNSCAPAAGRIGTNRQVPTLPGLKLVSSNQCFVVNGRIVVQENAHGRAARERCGLCSPRGVQQSREALLPAVVRKVKLHLYHQGNSSSTKLGDAIGVPRRSSERWP